MASPVVGGAVAFGAQQLVRDVISGLFVLSEDQYGVGDVVIWDNASLLHSATLTDPDDPRTLWRITIKEPTLAAAETLAPTFAAGGM